MPVPGKKQYSVYLTEKDAEYLKSIIRRGKDKGGFSALIDDYVCKLASSLRRSGLEQGQRIAWLDIVRKFFNGL